MSNPVTIVNNPILQRGSQGAKVKELQELLNREFGQRNQLAVDGIFGDRTHRAVKIIQYRFFLTQDGIVGLKTWQVLQTHSLIEKPQLRRGSRSELVRRVQQVLKDGRFYKGIVDGDFGRQTEEAVKALQKEHNPSGVNGIINDETWQALVELATMLTSN